MTFQAVLFDMDGTLINSEPYWLIAETELMADFGYQWQLSDQALCLGGPLTKVGQYMSDLAGGAEDWEFFTNSLVHRVTDKFHKGLTFMPGALELLEAIHSQSIPLALVSASPRSLVQAALDSLPHGYFQISISNDDVVNTKPHPESYLKAAALLNVEISESLVLEDSITGVTSGIASGAKVLAIPHLVKIESHPRVRELRSLVDTTLESIASLF
ncbi:MAG: HAD family phosphatase [Actinomycetes bacterium]|jgi:HAD superfamily hydrolase (TIGR01509 family)